MSERIGRLRWSEWLAATGAVALAVFMFALNWYDDAPPRDGWQALPVLRWLLLVTVAVVIAAVLAQALARGPALSVSLDVVGLVLAAVGALALIVTLASTGASLCPGAFLGLAAALVMLVGVFASLRIEQGRPPDGAPAIEVVALPAPDGPGS